MASYSVYVVDPGAAPRNFFLLILLLLLLLLGLIIIFRTGTESLVTDSISYYR